MAELYVSLIIKGLRTYAQVPKFLKPKVKAILIELDLEELIIEEGGGAEGND